MIRFAKPQDHPQLKLLWAEAFGDPQDAVDLYFAQRHVDANMLIYVHMGEVAGMLSMLPLTLCASSGRRYSARYIYAVATRRQYRSQGISTALLQAAHTYMQKEQIDASTLVPASAALFSFYEKRGYQAAFMLDILSLEAKALPPVPPQCSCTACSANEYSLLRNQAFQTSSLFACWDEAAVAYAVQTFAASGGVSKLVWDGGYGCAAWETTDNGILVRELALKNGDVYTALAVLHSVLNAQHYTVRLAPGTSANANFTPFGMIHWFSAAPSLTGTAPYFSLAMD